MRDKPLPGIMKHSPLKHHQKNPDGKVIRHYQAKEKQLKPKKLHSLNLKLPIGTYPTKGE